MKSWWNIPLRAGFRSTPTSLTTGQYIHLHTQPLPTPAFLYMAFVCTYINTPSLCPHRHLCTWPLSVHTFAHLAFFGTVSVHLAFVCIYTCTPGLCLYLHLHTCFFSFSDISVHLAFVGPGLYLHLHTCFFSFSDVSVHLAFVGTGLNLHTWPLSVHVSVHLAFVSTSICTPVCGVSTPHTRTCSFQPVG